MKPEVHHARAGSTGLITFRRGPACGSTGKTAAAGSVSGGEPRLFRVSRVASAVVDEAPVRRQDGADLVGLWASLRREAEDRRADLAAVAAEVAAQYSNVRLDMG